LGFQKNGGDFYPDDHQLVVVVNKDGGSTALCEKTGACFREIGFPRHPAPDGLGGWYYDCTDPSLDHDDQHYFFSYSADRYNDPVFGGASPWHPTMIISETSGYAPYSGVSHHPYIYHEFTHYVQKRYADSGFWSGNYDNVDDFNQDEGGPFKEGFAYYFAASIEEENTHNFHRDQLRCNSDDWWTPPGSWISKSMNLQYDVVFQCCGDEHNAGYVISQILWDMRQGIGTDDALGKAYTDQLAFQTVVELSLGGVDTTDGLFALMVSIAADPEMASFCPLASVTDCQVVINQAFLRHGLCFIQPCSYTTFSCGDPECQNARCMRDHVDNCAGVDVVGRCDESTQILCCAAVCLNSNYHSCMSEALCEANCIENLWSYERRDCIDTFGSGDSCNKCSLY
jgi:hypothetical protein